MGLLAFDLETTGLDAAHGAAPFFATIADGSPNVKCYEWEVDPITRKVRVDHDDVTEINQLLLNNPIVTHNGKFDTMMWAVIDPNFKWPWHHNDDTLTGSHILESNQPHNLTDLATVWLGRNILKYEDKLKKATQKARSICRSKFPSWRIAKKGLLDMPSAKAGKGKDKRGIESDSPWKFDTWLPKRLAQELKYPNDHPWYTVLEEYANVDSQVTWALWQVQWSEIKRRGLELLYKDSLKQMRLSYEMECNGVTASKDNLVKQMVEYEKEAEIQGADCVGIAKAFGYELDLPKGGRSNSLQTFVFDVMKLPVVKLTDAGAPSLDKGAMDEYKATLKPKSKELAFVDALSIRKKCLTAISYMNGYQKFWVKHGKYTGWYKLHPSLNPCGTHTLRFSGRNPNPQNISKKKHFNLRYCFGPAPGREWWSLDYENLELRIPAYEVGEEAMIELFERPNDPPYFGSYHLLIFDILHPEKFAQYGADCKDVFKSTWYSWTKNGDFAIQYGAMESSGTADRAYHVPGAQARIESKFTKIKGLSNYWIEHAQKYGYVEAMKSSYIDPNKGYPLCVGKNEYRRVKPTEPLSYHIQSTAMQATRTAINRCDLYLKQLTAETGKPHFTTLQIHDELDFDLPFQKDMGNLPKVLELRRLMELSGSDINVPLKVSVTYHSKNWSEGIAI